MPVVTIPTSHGAGVSWLAPPPRRPPQNHLLPSRPRSGVILEKIQNFFKVLITSIQKNKKEYEEECNKMSHEEKLKESDKRMEAYKALCLGGLTSMYWKDTTALLNKVRAISGPFALVLSEGFAVSQAGMLIGLVASSFPKSSPWSLGAASNGSLFAVLFNIASFHLEIIEFLPSIALLISWILISVAFALYWCVGSQDLTIVRLLCKFAEMFLSIIVNCVLTMFRYLTLDNIVYCMLFMIRFLSMIVSIIVYCVLFMVRYLIFPFGSLRRWVERALNYLAVQVAGANFFGALALAMDQYRREHGMSGSNRDWSAPPPTLGDLNV